MSGALLPVYRWQIFYNGSPAAGALLYSYLSGTATPQPLYSDSALGTEHDNPVEADANGVFPIMYMAAVAYRITITTSAGVTIFAAQDNVYDLWQLFTATTQTANTVYAGPTSGSAAAPTFRALVQADLPVALTDVGIAEGRLTLTSGTPVTIVDATSTTVYYAPYTGDRIALYDGAAWNTRTFTEKSIAIPATTATMYDVWAYDNSGVVALELTAWTNVTTRATALTTQNGVYVKSGTLTRRYLGSFCTSAVSGQSTDSAANRLLWNYYHRVRKSITVTESTASWDYSALSWQQARAQAANQVALVQGVAECTLNLGVWGMATNSGGGTASAVGIAEDNTTAPIDNTIAMWLTSTSTAAFPPMVGSLIKVPAVGYHYYPWLEISSASGTTTFYGGGTTYGGENLKNGLDGVWTC